MSSQVAGIQSLASGACGYLSLSCNQTVTGYIGPGDCQASNGVYVDFWQFHGTSGQSLTAYLHSVDFDAWLQLFNPSNNTVAYDDDSGGNFDALLTYPLDATGTWTIAAAGRFAYETGNYTLQVTCSGTAPPPPPPPPPTSGPCVPDDHTLCIDENSGDSRYKITVDYNSNAGSGQGHAVPLSTIGFNRGGMFWFFDSTNPEMLVKVLHGCGVNNYHWVFFAATTNVGLTVRVTDTQSGVTKTYTNANGHPADPVTDTTAFSCP